MKNYLFYLFLMVSPLISFSQENRENTYRHTDGLTTVQDFIDDLADLDKPIDVIMSQWVIVDHPSDELYDYLEISLQEIRLNLSSKNVDQIVFKNYRELPIKEVRDIDIEDQDINNMFFLYYKQRLVTSLYVEGDKIRSFTLVSKGDNMAHFVTY
ncbi:hypothetical protein ACS126_01865 [Sphingobacterium lactis]|uniref:hypothetical protein n=1 Tax=Sphingobacterium lactis TaxID=797291 RepID=UPI003EC613D4